MNLKKFSIFIFVLFFLQTALNSSPKKISELTPSDAGKKPTDRPSVALVLSGGGAKGFAELPIMEYIEQLDIPIDMIIGTSVGAIIGGFYSSGYTAQGIVDNFSTVDWSAIFGDIGDSPYEDIYGIHGTNQTPLTISFGTDFSLKLGKGISKGQNAYEIIRSLLLKIPSDIHFNDLHIPFRAVATDMNSGNAYVLQDGDIAEAIRSSMSLPAVFKPYYIDSFCFMDGGLRYNLAINVAKQMGYDIIIAIDITEPVLNKPNEFTADPGTAILNTIGIAQYTVTEQLFKDADLIISPQVKAYGILDFQKSQMIYEEGKRTVEQYRESLEEIRKKIYPKDYDSQGNRKSEYRKMSQNSVYDSYNDFVLSDIEIHGTYNQDYRYIKKCFQKIQNKPLLKKDYDVFMENVYGTGNYQTVRSKIIRRDNQAVLKLELYPNEPQEFKILAGGDMEITFSDTKALSVNMDVDVQFRGLTGIGSLVSLHGSFFTDFLGELYYMQPITPYVFFDTKIRYMTDRYNTIEDDVVAFSRSTHFSTFGVFANLGFKVLGNNLFTIGGFYKFVDNSFFSYIYDPKIAAYAVQSMGNLSIFRQYLGISENLKISLVDSEIFTTKGFYIDSVTKFLLPVDSKTQKITSPLLIERIEAKFAVPFGERFSFSVAGLWGAEFLGNMMENFPLLAEEGFSTFDRVFFPSTGIKQRFGKNVAATSVCFQFKPFNHVSIFGGEFFARLEGTVGIVNYKWDDSFTQFIDPYTYCQILWSGALGAGLRVKGDFNIHLRLGVCSTDSMKVSPLFTLDIGNFRF